MTGSPVAGPRAPRPLPPPAAADVISEPGLAASCWNELPLRHWFTARIARCGPKGRWRKIVGRRGSGTGGEVTMRGGAWLVVAFLCGCGGRTGVARDASPGVDLNCSFAARCVVYNQQLGLASCSVDPPEANPCCPARLHGVLVRACNTSTGECLTFSDECLPAGWTSLRNLDPRFSAAPQ